MKLYDAFEMGIYNLRRSVLRTVLTTLGVVIGIGTLSSMISFGVGMESNIMESFKNNDMFTSLIITEKQIDIDAVAGGDLESITKDTLTKSAPLNDSTIDLIKQIKEVEIVYPEISVPAKLKFGVKETKVSIKALPAKMADYPPFNKLTYGRFIKSDEAKEIIVSERILRQLKIIIKSKDIKELTKKELTDGFRLMPQDSVIGKDIKVITATLNKNIISNAAMSFLLGKNKNDSNKHDETSFMNNETTFRIVGIRNSEGKMMGNRIGGEAIISLQNAKSLPKVNFNSVWDLLGKSSETNKSAFQSVYIRVKSPEYVDKVKQSLKKMNFNILSFLDELDEIRRNFMIVDLILSAIGIVSLFVAALGIINTMVMSILERKKEIGIMKAIGGGESDIRKIFFVEASIIGIFGGIFGLLLGWSVTQIASLVINSYIKPTGVEEAHLFSFPYWLIGGAMLFSLIISLISGLYPAYRAAKVDPVIALRNE
jgi:putative ABC transport system permease protein